MGQQAKLFDGKLYRIYDAYPTKQAAESTASGLRTTRGSVFPPPIKTLARVVDLGETAGRLRYAVYIRAGD